jgi:Holliday junction resolvasome RuvABC endonuclease subunit
MIILALDLATQTGWCLLDSGRILESGSQSFAKKRGESNGLLFLRARKWLADFSAWGPQLVAYEQAHFRGGAATELCVGLQTRAQEIAAEWGVPSAPVSTGTLKKFATGSGTAGKLGMIAFAAGKLGRPPIDDNEADAVAVAFWACEQFGSTPTPTWEFT